MTVAVALAVAGCTTASGPATGSSSSSAATASSATATESAVAAGGSQCTDEELDISSGAINDGAGHVSLTLILTDNSSVPCYVQGYPDVAVDLPTGGTYDADHTMTGYMGGDNAQSPAQVSLVPGESASALIEWVDSPQNGSSSFSAADCTGYGAASSLEVTAPNQTTPTRVDNSTPNSPICWGFEVHPVVPGSTGQLTGSATPSS